MVKSTPYEQCILTVEMCSDDHTYLSLLLNGLSAFFSVDYLYPVRIVCPGLVCSRGVQVSELHRSKIE